MRSRWIAVAVCIGVLTAGASLNATAGEQSSVASSQTVVGAGRVLIGPGPAGGTTGRLVNVVTPAGLASADDAALAETWDSATVAPAAEVWKYRDCPSGKVVGAVSAREGGSVTYHAYYQGGLRVGLFERHGTFAGSASGANYATVHFLTDGSGFAYADTACGG